MSSLRKSSIVAIAQTSPSGHDRASDRPPLHAWVLATYVIVVGIVTIQRGVLGHPHWTYPVFRESFYHLLHHQDLYARYPSQGSDRFKYSPTFALLFAPFALPPFVVGLLLWDACNAFAVYYALKRLLPEPEATLATILVLPEVLIAVQASQSDALVAALIIGAFLALERGRQLAGGAAIAVGAAIKLFPLAGAVFALPHRRRWRFALCLAMITAVLAALPLLVLSPGELLQQYRSWGAITGIDAATRGASVMGLLAAVAPGSWPNWPVQLAGTLILLLPIVLRRSDWESEAFRRAMLCSVLVYAVIFNHRAERSSFVIATAGIVAWYLSSPRTALRTAILVLSLVGLKAAPCLLAWGVMQVELLRGSRLTGRRGAGRARSWQS
jgi:hypothetical protein